MGELATTLRANKKISKLLNKNDPNPLNLFDSYKHAKGWFSLRSYF